MADVTAESQSGTTGGIGLSRTINLAQISWMTIAWVAVLLAGAAIRLFQIGLATLSATEARKAYDAWSLVYGNTEGVHNDLTKTQPTGLLLRALSFFLFGDSDTNVRIPSALLGIGLIVLVWSIRDLLGEWRALGAAALVALSPTVVYASRTANEEIDALFFGVLLVIDDLPLRRRLEGARYRQGGDAWTCVGSPDRIRSIGHQSAGHADRHVWSGAIRQS